MRCLWSRLLTLVLLPVLIAIPARAQGTRIKDLPLTTSFTSDARLPIDSASYAAPRGVSLTQLATNIGTLAVANKLNTTNGVAIGLSTPTAPTTGDSVVNKTALDAAVAAGDAYKIDITNGVAVNLTTATAPTTGNSVVNKTALDAAVAAGGASKLDTTNGVAVNLTTATIAAGTNDIVSLRAAWKLNGDVRYWGAVGDGTTDDTTAITAAVAAVTNIFIPAGTYLINGTTIPIGDNFQVRTPGPGSVTLKRTTGGSAVFTAAANRGATNVVISGVRFQGAYWDTGDITRSAVTFQTNGTFGAVVRDCVFEGFVAGVRCLRGNTNLTVMHSRAAKMSDTLVLAYAPVGGKFIGNTVDGDRTGIGDGYRTRVGIWLHDPGDGAGPGWGNIVADNRISTLRNEGIIVNQAFSIVQGNIVTDCTDGASGTYGIVVETTGATGSGLVGLGAGNWVSVVNNQVYNCDGGVRVSVDPVNLTQATPQDVFVSGNLVEGCTGANTKGVCVGFSETGTNYYTYRANVVDNWIHNAAATGNADGVYLFNVQHGAVTGNHVYNAKRYGVILDTLAAGTTNQVAGVSISANDIHDPGSAGVFLYPRIAGSIVRCAVVGNHISFSGAQTGNGIEVDNGVTAGLIEGSFLGNTISGNSTINGYGLLVNGNNLVAAGNTANSVYNRTIATNGTTTWLSNGSVNDVNGRRIFFNTSAPSTSAYQQNVGDLCYNTSPTAGAAAVWICTVANVAGSTSATWQDIGIVGAQAALDLKYDKTGGTISGNASITGTLGVTGVLTASSDITIPSNKNYRAYDTGGTLRNVLGIDGSNFLQVGDGSPARLVLNVGSSGLYLGTVSAGADIYVPRSGVASSGTTLRNSRSIDFITSYYSGSEVTVDNTIVGVAVNTSGKTGIKFRANAFDVAYFYSDGQASFPGSISSPAIDASGSGFTGSGAGITALSAANISTGTLVAARGGTGQGSYTLGDTLYASSSTFLSKVAIGTNGQVYTVSSGAPAWSTPTVAIGNVTGLGSGVGTWLATPSSANLAAAITDETGTGAVVFANSPTLVTPALGTPSSVNLANATGLPISTGVSGLGTGMATALGLAPTGSGVVVLGTNAALTTPTITGGVLTNTTVSSSAQTQKVAVWNSSGVLGASSVSNTELNYLSGVTSAVQTQLDGKEPTITTLAAGKLPTSGVTAGSYGNASYTTTITVDTYGRVTAVSTNAISGGGGSTTTSFVTFDGSVGVTTISSGNGFTNGGVVINMTSHGLTTGDVVWFQNSTKGPVIDTAYYATVVDADNYKISTSQANRVAATFVAATASGVCYMRRWNSNPILASSNVDGVIRPWSKTDGTYIVDFTTNPSDAYYAVAGSAKTVTDGTPLLFTGESRAATASAFAVQVTDTSGGLTDSDRVSITVTR